MKHSFIIIICVAIVSCTLFSCQHENDETIIYEYTAEQKAEIQYFADKYGLKISFLENKDHEPLMSVSEIKHLMRGLHSMKGRDYPVYFDEPNDEFIAVIKPAQSVLTKAAVEVGSWSGYLTEEGFSFHLYISKNHQSFDADVSVSYGAIDHKFVFTKKDVYQGIASEIVNVDIEGYVSSSSGGIGLSFNFYGYVNLDLNYGSIHVLELH